MSSSRVQIIFKLSIDIKSIMEIVFDGNRLGNKSKEEDKRSYHREEQQRVARDLLEQGEEEKDKRIYVASLDITPQMVKKVAEKLKVMGVEYIVAPYKADAQLAYWIE